MKTYLYVYKNNILTFFYTVYDQTSVKKKCWKIIHKFVHNVLALKKKRFMKEYLYVKKKSWKHPYKCSMLWFFFQTELNTD